MSRARRGLFLSLFVYAFFLLGSMATMSVGAALVAVTVVWCARGPQGVVSWLRDELARPWSRRYAWVALALATACAWSLAAAVFVPVRYGAGEVKVNFLADMAKAWYLFWPLLLAAVFRRFEQSERAEILRVWIAAFGLLSIVGIFQFYTGWPRPQPIPFHEGRFHATLFLGHHLSVASIFIFPLFASLDFLLERESKLRLPRWTLGAVAAAGIATLFLGFSRTLWVALPIGLVLWAILSLPKKWKLATLGAIALAVAGASQVPTVRARLGTALGVGTRKDLWEINLGFFRDRPLSGIGWHHNYEASAFVLEARDPGKDHFAGHAHNNVLEMLASTGLPGTLAWFVWVVFVGVLAWQVRDAREFRLGRGLVCAWAVFQLNGLTQVNFWESKVLHQISWMVAWLLLLADGERVERA